MHPLIEHYKHRLGVFASVMMCIVIGLWWTGTTQGGDFKNAPAALRSKVNEGWGLLSGQAMNEGYDQLFEPMAELSDSEVKSARNKLKTELLAERFDNEFPENQANLLKEIIKQLDTDR